MTPWWKGAVIYQIYPRSFGDADGDGVGDLKGVLERLDYVASLGVDGIWLSPFFKSPMKDFGYDVADYCNVDPLFGTLADFDALVEKAHALGLKIIIDQVYSHTSDAHPWFAESRAAKGGSKSDFYVWADAKSDGTAPNNWMSVFGGPSWEWAPERRQYYLHNFLAAQPDLNFHNAAVRAEILKVAEFWLARGVDGFRLDVINYCTHDAALRDNPAAPHKGAPPAETFFHQRHVYNCSRPENLDFVAALRASVDKTGDKMLLGEIFDDAPLQRQIEYTGEGRLHTAYSFHFLNARAATPTLFAEAIAAWENVDGWPSWSLGNHDVVRFPTRLFGDAPSAAQIRLALAVLLCLKGTIFLYQGDELGLSQADVPPDRLRDPFAIRNRAGAGRDGARTPFPWKSHAPNAGFSSAKETWLPLDPCHPPLAVDGQEADAESMLAFTRRLLALRRRLPALVHGAAKLVTAGDNILAFERAHKGERILCCFNLGGTPVSYPAPAGARLIEAGLGGAFNNKTIDLPPWSGALVASGK